MNGYPAILHGGIVATLLDETMGSLLILNKALKNPALTPDFVTLELVTKFKKPVRTPQVVLVVAEIKEVKGRKVFLSARVDDGSGGVLAMGEALFVGLKGKI